MSASLRFLLAVLSVSWFCADASAQAPPVRRLALVIGNDAYAPLKPLRKAVGDAEAMSKALTDIGFSVTLVRNASHKDMSDALDAFAAQIEQDDEVVVHFSGHGVSVNGRNYLLPVEMREPQPGQDITLYRRAFDSQVEIEALRARRPKYVFVILDACRDNPFMGVGRSIGLTRGILMMPVEVGAFVIYSAGEGETALDRVSETDPEKTSVFTRVMLKHLPKPGLSFEALASTVKDEVKALALKSRNHNQFPEYRNRTIGALSLNPPPEPPRPGPGSEADACYALAMRALDDKPLETCLNKHPNHSRVAAAITALEIRDKRDFDIAVASGTAAALEAYIEKRPFGDHVPEAKRKLAVEGFSDRLKPCEVGTVAVFEGSKVVEKRRCLTPGAGKRESFKDCTECPEMVLVSGGSFMMGSLESEPERDSDEGPQHSVTIPRAFAVGKFEVSFDEWDACVKDGGCDGYKPDDNKWGRSRLPVINVSWNQAQSYVAWISKKTGRTYRLLSEAEWEYVARAGTQTPFWWGKTITTKQANYNGNFVYDNGTKGEYRGKTMPVNTLEANSWGLFHVHGNVLEWVEDCWMENYISKPDDLKKNGAPFKTESCTLRVVRGGSWSFNPRGLRSAYRFWDAPEYSSGSLGFRLARTL